MEVTNQIERLSLDVSMDSSLIATVFKLAY